MAKTVLLAAAAALALTAGDVAGQVSSATRASLNIRIVPTLRRASLKTLYTQNSNSSGLNVNSQNFSSGTYTSANDQAADDFVVPKGKTWRVGEVDVAGVYYNGAGLAQSENVYFYRDKNGMPGRSVK